MDGDILRPRLISVEFPGVEGMKEGLGEIQIEFSADLPPSRLPNPRMPTDHLLPSIRATSTPGASRNASGMLVTPERRISSAWARGNDPYAVLT
jgi:hypothetical protein